MPDPIAFRYRIRFAKTGALRFSSHLDLQHSWERTLRRAEIKLFFSEGFHPRPKFQFASALPLGLTSECEIFDAWLANSWEPTDLHQRINAAAPPGLTVVEIAALPLNAPAASTLIETATYDVPLGSDVDLAQLQQQISTFMGQENVEIERRGKKINLRALVFNLAVSTPDSAPSLSMRVSHQEGAMARAEDVVVALGLDPLAQIIHRRSLTLREQAPKASSP